MISTRSRFPKINNKYEQLQTVRKVAIIKAKGNTFINGITNKYDPQFPKQLTGLVDRSKYEESMHHLNRKLRQFWPCCFAYYCGYTFAIFTLGLSLLIPRMCITQAEAVLIKQINKINNEVLGNGKLEMRLIKKCNDSYLIIEERDFSQFELHTDITL